MDIHVDISGRYLEIDKVRDLLTTRQQTFEGICDRLMEIRVTHITSINEEKLLCTFLLGAFRFADESRYLTDGCLHLHWEEILIESFAKHIDDTLP